ncbi:13543_t:CDS:1 [Cetraspora pellucida]|uniref:13543_t:CDS:1 n=1 Tax=Cetraspora pellucida TaxID=1433469 RepID=A0ACA9NLY5_9GLOM|nr:13543_t:CDS:1 [Cetraspora pellucida]
MTAIIKYSSDTRAFNAEGEKLAGWLIVKYKAFNVIENSNKHNKVIQNLETILSKKHKQQNEEVLWLRELKKQMEIRINNSFQNNINLIDVEIDQLESFLEASSNDIKTKDEHIFQQATQYLMDLYAGNERLRKHLIKCFNMSINSGIKYAINRELFNEFSVKICEPTIDELKEMIQKLEDNINELNDERKKAEFYVREQFRIKFDTILKENFQNLYNEKNKLNSYILNQYEKFEIPWNNDNKEIFRALGDFNDPELLNSLRTLRNEKARLDDYLMSKYIISPSTQNGSQHVHDYENNNLTDSDLIELKNKNDIALNKLHQIQVQSEEFDKETHEESSFMIGINSNRHQIIQTLNNTIIYFYDQNHHLGNHLVGKYHLLIELENFNEEIPDPDKYRESIEELQNIEKDRRSYKTSNHIITYCNNENSNETIDNTLLFQTLYDKKESRKNYQTTQHDKIIEAFNDIKQKLENKIIYIKETEKYQKLQNDIHSLFTEKAKWGSDLISKYNKLIELEKFINNGKSRSVIDNERIQNLKDETKPHTIEFGAPNTKNIVSLIDKCEQIITTLEEEIRILQAEKNYIVKSIHTVKEQIESDLILKCNQLTQLEEFENWTLISNERLQKMKQLPGIPINNSTSLNKVKGGNDRIQQLEKEVLDLKGELEESNNKIHELHDKNNSLRDEVVKYSSELGKATNFEFGDHDSNNISQLLKDILELKDDLDSFCTLRQKYADINSGFMKTLAKQYECSSEFSTNNPTKAISQSLFQRYIIERILNSAEKYLNEERGERLEAEIISAATKLHDSANQISKLRTGTDKVSPAIPTKLRQLVYILLSNRGFSQITSKVKHEYREHPFISRLTKDIIGVMNNVRTIKDSVRNNEIESMTTEIVRRIIVIFLFRFKVQEPVVQYKWIQYGDKIDPEFMDVSLNDEDLKNAAVSACSFPLIATNLDDQNYKVISRASVLKANVVKKTGVFGNFLGY